MFYKRSVIWLCYMTTRPFLVLWFMMNMYKRQGHTERVMTPRGKHLLMEDLQREGLRFKTSIGARIGCLIKFFLSFISLGMIWFPTLSRKRERVLVHQLKNQLVESVARSTMVIVLKGQFIILAVVKVVIRSGISLM